VRGHGDGHAPDEDEAEGDQREGEEFFETAQNGQGGSIMNLELGKTGKYKGVSGFPEFRIPK
jgi:hypothetical protein